MLFSAVFLPPSRSMSPNAVNSTTNYQNSSWAAVTAVNEEHAKAWRPSSVRGGKGVEEGAVERRGR
jgi:hypothetical protein